MAFRQAGSSRLEEGRVQGNPVRYFLFRRNGKVLFDEHKKLFAYMKSFKGTKFMPVEEYIRKIWSNVGGGEKN